MRLSIYNTIIYANVCMYVYLHYEHSTRTAEGWQTASRCIAVEVPKQSICQFDVHESLHLPVAVLCYDMRIKKSRDDEKAEENAL